VCVPLSAHVVWIFQKGVTWADTLSHSLTISLPDSFALCSVISEGEGCVCSLFCFFFFLLWVVRGSDLMEVDDDRRRGGRSCSCF
jgi:4-hydroxybenzoate polyprenyltransferase